MFIEARFIPLRCPVRGFFATSAMLSAMVIPYDIASAAETACDAGKKQTCVELVQDNILWRISEPDNPASKHWAQENLANLCGCTADPYATVIAFRYRSTTTERPGRKPSPFVELNPDRTATAREGVAPPSHEL